MDVQVDNVSSTVRTMDSDAWLSPPVLHRIVTAVTRAMRDGEDQERRASTERRITGGVSAERDMDR